MDVLSSGIGEPNDKFTTIHNINHQQSNQSSQLQHQQQNWLANKIGSNRIINTGNHDYFGDVIGDNGKPSLQSSKHLFTQTQIPSLSHLQLKPEAKPACSSNSNSNSDSNSNSTVINNDRINVHPYVRVFGNINVDIDINDSMPNNYNYLSNSIGNKRKNSNIINGTANVNHSYNNNNNNNKNTLTPQSTIVANCKLTTIIPCNSNINKSINHNDGNYNLLTLTQDIHEDQNQNQNQASTHDQVKTNINNNINPITIANWSSNSPRVTRDPAHDHHEHG